MGTGREVAHRDRDQPGNRDAHQPADARQHRRLHQELVQNVLPPRADGFADADLARPLRHHRQHDVHDHHAADHHEHADDADRRAGDRAGQLIPGADQRVGGLDREIVVLLRTQMAVRAQQHAHFILGLFQLIAARAP